ncbi:hypothetical protein BRX43_18940 [Sphingomonas sp. S-NIH.Pt15_0812]|nr:hypothetical protein BRX43_18940 [Sphingomonas sp. S-NIH.Pt15_0812]
MSACCLLVGESSRPALPPRRPSCGHPRPVSTSPTSAIRSHWQQSKRETHHEPPLSFILSVLAFGGFGFVSHNHHQRLTRRRVASASKTRWQAGAAVALAFAFASAVAARGWAFGPVLWFGFVMFAAILVFLALNFWPQRIHKHQL